MKSDDGYCSGMWEMLRRQLEELNAQMDDMRQQSTNPAVNAAMTRLKEAVRTMGQSVSKTESRGYEKSGSQSVRSWQRF